MRGALWLAPLLAGACATAPDVFLRAERALLAQNLPEALVAFDAVPVAHERYPEARAAALAVERRMRRSHETLLEALLLRAEWRDCEALVVFERARVLWPHMPGVDAWIAATKYRATMLGRDGGREDGREDGRDRGEASDVVVPIPTHEAVIAAPDGEPPPPLDEVPLDNASAAPTVPVAAPVARAPRHAGEDPVALGLVAVEARLGRGDLEAAVVGLIELSRRFPSDQRVCIRLARVLHQRALQRYGQGQLAAAMVDWERVVTLDSTNAVAQNLLDAARAEALAATPSR